MLWNDYCTDTELADLMLRRAITIDGSGKQRRSSAYTTTIGFKYNGKYVAVPHEYHNVCLSPTYDFNYVIAITTLFLTHQNMEEVERRLQTIQADALYDNTPQTAGTTPFKECVQTRAMYKSVFDVKKSELNPHLFLFDNPVAYSQMFDRNFAHELFESALENIQNRDTDTCLERINKMPFFMYGESHGDYAFRQNGELFSTNLVLMDLDAGELLYFRRRLENEHHTVPSTWHSLSMDKNIKMAIPLSDFIKTSRGL